MDLKDLQYDDITDGNLDSIVADFVLQFPSKGLESNVGEYVTAC